MDRRQLRKNKIQARDSLSLNERSRASELIGSRIVSSPEFLRAGTVMVYRAVRGEVSLELVELSPAAKEKRLVYPVCVSGTEMIAVRPEGENAWQTGRFGIPEPDPDRGTVIPPVEIDLVICPCAAFDENGNRLGMGGGYYDRFLPRCVNARVAAAAFETQKADRVPAEPWDQPMDMVFTEKGIYRADRRL